MDSWFGSVWHSIWTHSGGDAASTLLLRLKRFGPANNVKQL